MLGPVHPHLIPSPPHFQWHKPLSPELDLAPTCSLGPCVCPHSTLGLGTQELLTGGLQNSMSSGPTKVIGTLSEFSAISEDGEEGHSLRGSVPLSQRRMPPAHEAAAAAAASCSDQPFCSHPFQHPTSPLPSSSTQEQSVQPLPSSQKCPLLSLSSPKPPSNAQIGLSVEVWVPFFKAGMSSLRNALSPKY